jgi:hypothetical protein
VSGKAEHNRLLAGDILLKVVERQRASEAAKLPALFEDDGDDAPRSSG